MCPCIRRKKWQLQHNGGNTEGCTGESRSGGRFEVNFHFIAAGLILYNI